MSISWERQSACGIDSLYHWLQRRRQCTHRSTNEHALDFHHWRRQFSSWYSQMGQREVLQLFHSTEVHGMLCVWLWKSPSDNNISKWGISCSLSQQSYRYSKANRVISSVLYTQNTMNSMSSQCCYEFTKPNLIRDTQHARVERSGRQNQYLRINRDSKANYYCEKEHCREQRLLSS